MNDASEMKLRAALEQAEASVPQTLAALDSHIAVIRAAIELQQQHGRMLLELMASENKHQLYKRASVFGWSRRLADGAMKIACMKVDWSDPTSVARVIRLSEIDNAARVATNVKGALEARARIKRAAVTPPAV